MPQERVRCPLAEVVAHLVALKASLAFDPGEMNLGGQGQGVQQAQENPDPDAGTLGGVTLDRDRRTEFGRLELNLVVIN